MKIERDKEHDLLYIELREGEVEETIDIAEGAHLDVDAEGFVLGVEFLALEAFENYVEEHGGQLNLPVWVRRRQVSQPSTIEPSVLTQRQLEVLELIAQGMTNRQIAERLDVSLNTVKQVARSILKHLEVDSRLEAAIYYVEHTYNVPETEREKATDSVA